LREVVLDTSVIARWFGPTADPASALWRSHFEAGEVDITIPSLLFVELLNIAGRQWRWTGDRLLVLVRRLEESRLEVAEAPLARIASWTARGLTAYDATYVALAEERGIGLVTNDRQILALAEGIARPTSLR